MRIALLSSASSVHTIRWAEGLERLGQKVHVFSLESPADGGSSVGGAPVEKISSPPLPGFLRYPLAAPGLAGRLSRFAPDVVDAHFVPNYGLLGVLAGRHPLAVNCWGSDLLLARDAFRRARARWVLAHADRVRVDAENLAACARGLGVPESRLTVLPWGVDTLQFSFAGDAASRRSNRESWPATLLERAGPSHPVVMSTRVLHPLYDVESLVRAWPEVARAVPEARAVIVGDGPERQALENQARRLAVADSILFVGRVSPRTLPQILRGADVYVSTSLSDSTSLSLLEAMAVGAYPVVSDIPGNREWVSAETAGLFAPRDASGLARLLVAALGDPTDHAAARATNRRTVEMRGDWGRYLERVVGEFRELLAARGKRGVD